MNEPITINIGNICNGALIEAFDLKLAEVLKAGGVTRSEIKLPQRIKLFAYRTFREIDPVESEFIVRLQAEKDQLPKIALMEVDAGRWKLDSVGLVAKWLRKELPAATVIA